jgi:lipopolysaccharide transport system ATP-binding protein
MGVKNKVKGFLNGPNSATNNVALEDNVAVNVEHLTMEFKITKDKIDTLKEYVIRTIKRNKKEKEKIKVLDDISFKVYRGD